MSSGSDTKECPFCLETIKAGALRCKHCHADLTDTAPAPARVSLLAGPTIPAVPTASVSPPPAALKALHVLDLLAHLVDKGMVVFEEDERGPGRYRLLETVRQYARDRLRENEEAHALLRPRHRNFFLAVAEEAKPNLQGPEQARWLDTLESEHDNLRAALEWCLDEEEGAEAGLRLAGALSQFWWTRGHLSEGRQRCAEVLSHPGAQDWTKARADALNGAGSLARLQGDYASARVLFEEGLALYKELDDKQGMAASLNNLGLVASSQGGTASARSLFEESLAIMRELGDKQSIAGSLGNLGNVAREQGDYASARALLEESLALRRELGDKRGIANSLLNLGRLDCQEKNYAASRYCLAECLTLCRVLGDKRIMAYALECFAALARAQEQPDRAAQLYGASDALRAAIGVPLPPNEREEVERALAALRPTLGEEAFNGAWTAGCALTWEQAIEYALEDEASP